MDERLYHKVSFSNGHPVKLTKADRKNTIIKYVHKSFVQDECENWVWLITYETGIGSGIAKFAPTPDGEKLMEKFERLLKR